MIVGTRVTHSDYANEQLRQASMGGWSQRSRDAAKRELDKRRKESGTVTALPTDSTCTVRWDHGVTSTGFNYMYRPLE